MAEQDYPPGIQTYIERGEQMTAAEAAQRALMRTMKFDTIAVHGIYGLEAALANQGSINEPAYLSSAQHFENSDHMEAALAYLMPSWAYSRIANPTWHYLEETLALLEGYGFAGEVSCCATGSGMARQPRSSASNAAYSAAVGSRPCTSRYATSSKLACSARSWIE